MSRLTCTSERQHSSNLTLCRWTLKWHLVVSVLGRSLWVSPAVVTKMVAREVRGEKIDEEDRNFALFDFCVWRGGGTRIPPDHRKETQTVVVWTCFPFIRSGHNHLASHSERGRRQGRQRKRWEDNIREWTGFEFGKSQRAVENREKWRKLVAKSSVVPQRLSRLMDWWWWWWWVYSSPPPSSPSH